MSICSNQEVWYDTQTHCDEFAPGNTLSSTSTFTSPIDRYPIQQRKNAVEICRDLAGRISRRSDKSVTFVSDVIKTLLCDPDIDLCSILEHSPNDGTFQAVGELIDQHSHFFDVFFDGNEQLIDELWQALYRQVQNCHLSTNISSESILMVCISGYVVRLLPIDNSDLPEVRRPSVRQRVHTPLDLFLPTSPILNRIRFDQDVETRGTSSTLHPRHLTMFCNLVSVFCSVDEFPSPSRLIVLRHLLKQFHSFCTSETTDPDMIAIKNAIFSNPPFSNALYEFFSTFMEQCPSTNSLQDLIHCWIAYCRPWRYSQSQNEVPADILRSPQYLPFIRSQERFYRILLGKILRKLSEHEINANTARTIKSVLDLTWKEPFCSLLRKVLAVDARPAARKLLNRLAEVYRVENIKVKIAEQEAKESWWKTILGQMETPQAESSRVIVEQLNPILKDADTFMGTNYLPESAAQSLAQVQLPLGEESRTNVRSSTFDETPKRGILPDHTTDPATGLMYVTPSGRNQILNRERRFNFSPCHSYIPHWQSAARQNEFPPMVYLTRKIAEFLNCWKPVQELGSHYFDSGPFGSMVRVVMDPPCPNPQSSVASPIFSRNLKKTPPTLRVRILANNLVLVMMSLIALFLWLGWWAFFPLLLVGFVLLMFYLSTVEQF